MLGQGTLRDQLGKGCMLLPTGMDTDIVFFTLNFLFHTPFLQPKGGAGYSLLFLPAIPLSPSQALEGLFRMTQRPSTALNLASLPRLFRDFKR